MYRKEDENAWEWCNRYNCLERDIQSAKRTAEGIGRNYRGIAKKTIIAEGKVERVEFLHSQGTVLSGEFICHHGNEPKRQMYKEQKEEKAQKEEEFWKIAFEF